MRYSITFTEKDYTVLTDHLFSDCSVEQAAYLLCRSSVTANEFRLLVREVIPVAADDIEHQNTIKMKIKSRSFLRVMKTADQRGECFLFVHSHPNGLQQFSRDDDSEEKKLFRTAYIRISGEGVHGSIVFPDAEKPMGRIWLNDGTTAPIDVIRVIGNKFKFYLREYVQNVSLHFFDRQVRAFGKDIQILLGNLRIGIVGVGGTGSAVAEQLIRLGVGNLLVIDGDTFNPTNINRVYGTRVIDESIPKVKLIERLAADIGLNTQIQIVQKHIFYKSSFSLIRDCDIVFGCTDDEMGRSLLTRLAIYYYIPVFDMGVKVDTQEDGTTIRSINGRVTTLIPSAACLYCRGRIHTDRIAAESLARFNPEEYHRRRKEEYVQGLDDPAPAIIPLNTAVASYAVLELLHRLTGCLGDDRQSTELIHLFNETRIRTNNRTSLQQDCFCNDVSKLGRGDTIPLLDCTWPQE